MASCPRSYGLWPKKLCSSGGTTNLIKLYKASENLEIPERLVILLFPFAIPDTKISIKYCKDTSNQWIQKGSQTLMEMK